jgi:RNA polymerase sigma-70 factor (ECF subfamily)
LPHVRDADHVLWEQIRAGAGAAFALLFERYYDALCAFASMYTASHAEAEEVAEDVFVRLWEQRARLYIRDSLKSYLYTATRNRALNRVRHEQAELRWIDEASQVGNVPGMGQAGSAVDDTLQAQEFARAIETAVSHLPARCQQVFRLHRQHGLTYTQIAEVLEISAKTVENLLGRSLKRLRLELARFFDK